MWHLQLVRSDYVIGVQIIMMCLKAGAFTDWHSVENGLQPVFPGNLGDTEDTLPK